jgi:hypothetical protein
LWITSIKPGDTGYPKDRKHTFALVPKIVMMRSHIAGTISDPVGVRKVELPIEGICHTPFGV